MTDLPLYVGGVPMSQGQDLDKRQHNKCNTTTEIQAVQENYTAVRNVLRLTVRLTVRQVYREALLE